MEVLSKCWGEFNYVLATTNTLVFNNFDKREEDNKYYLVTHKYT